MVMFNYLYSVMILCKVFQVFLVMTAMNVAYSESTAPSSGNFLQVLLKASVIAFHLALMCLTNYFTSSLKNVDISLFSFITIFVLIAFSNAVHLQLLYLHPGIFFLSHQVVTTVLFCALLP